MNLAYQVWGLAINWSERKVWLQETPGGFPLTIDRRMSIVCQVLVLGTFVTIVELTVKWNHIGGANSLASDGQLIALITSLGGFLDVCNTILTRRRDYLEANPAVTVQVTAKSAGTLRNQHS